MPRAVFFSSEPPPVSTMPRSTMSADNSGGVRSSAIRTASTITFTVAANASRISSSVMVIALGIPAMRWRPLMIRSAYSRRGIDERFA